MANRMSLDYWFNYLIGISILLLGVVALIPTLSNATGEVANSGVPLASLFSPTSGVILLLIMAGLVGVIYKGARSGRK